MGEDGAKIYRTVTQYSMKPIEEIGLLKMDFLGLRNLDVIEDALTIIERSSGSRIDMATLPLDDEKTYAMMARGDAVGVFQFESEGMREALKKVQPTEFEDLVALVALYRPGAMDQIPTYARGKRNPDSITYIDDRLRPITEATKGVILYQEQSMQIAKALAGFSGPRADDLRKAIGKKNREAMAAAQARVRRGLPRLGHERGGDRAAVGDQREVRRLLVQPLPRRLLRADRLPHRVAEGQLPRRVHGGADQLASCRTKDKVPFFVARCEEMGIEILPPDVNVSDHEFMVVEGNIRFGLDAVKGVGYAAVEAMKRARDEGGPFTSLWDFCERVDCRTVNKKAIEALIKCGAFGSTGATRRGMLDVLEAAQGAGAKAQLDAQIGQGSIFDLGPIDGGASPFAAPATRRSRRTSSSAPELLAIEKESIGLFISDHPLKRVREALHAKADCACAEVMERKDGEFDHDRRHDHRGQEDPHARRRSS